MDTLLSRYRNVTVLILVLLAQLILLAYQIKTGEDVRLIRVWAVSAITPLARLAETGRERVTSFFENYLALVGVREQNRRLASEIGRLKIENQYLRAELATAERAEALAAFQKRYPSRTVAARIIATGAGPNSKVVFLDRGAGSGVRKGMAVVTPDGIVGRVMAVYPNAAQVLLVTDVNFAAGVVSQKHRIQGTLKGTGQSTCLVDYVQAEERVDLGEWFYTSGEDRLFPRGLPVGQVSGLGAGKKFKEIQLKPSGFVKGLEEVLVVLEGLHLPVPALETAPSDIVLLPAPPASEASTAPERSPFLVSTEADRLRDEYRRIGEVQNHIYGEGSAPDFNIRPRLPAPADNATSPNPSPAKQAGPPENE